MLMSVNHIAGECIPASGIPARGGKDYRYRLWLTPSSEPSFALATLAASIASRMI